MKHTIVLGLDIATSTGWAILNGGKLVAYGHITCNVVEHGVSAYSNIIRGLKDVVLAYNPTAVYIEGVYNRNTETYKHLVLKHGVAVATIIAASRAVPDIVWLPAATVRSRLGIKGRLRDELKAATCQWANNKFGLGLRYNGNDDNNHDDDIADAVAVAYAGYNGVDIYENKKTRNKRKSKSGARKKISKEKQKGKGHRKAGRTVSKGGASNSKSRKRISKEKV